MVTRVPVSVETLAPTGRTAGYVVDDLLVDPAARSGALDGAVAEGDVAHVALTHHHPDHVGALAAYAREFDLTTWCLAGRTASFEEATGLVPDRTFHPGATIPPESSVRVLDTPGHAPEHVAFETPEGLLTGDLAVAEGSVVVGAPEGDVRAYLTSLRRVHARNPDRLYPSHGPVIEEPRAVCSRLIDHRLDRERRVLTAVREGARDPASIVDAAYDKDLEGVRDLATATVLAHVEKLAVEGHLDWDGETATP